MSVPVSSLLRFTYAAAWLAKDGAVPISKVLALSSETFSGKRTRPFFAGILPEAGPRARMAEILGISENNDLAMPTPTGRTTR